MKVNRSLASIAAALALFGTAWAQNSGPMTGTINDAFQVARPAVKPDVQNKVVSCYGLGTPSTIQKWYIIFYDPSVASHGRAVLVEDNKITKTYPANGGKTYSEALAFDPSRITNEGPALTAAQDYAAKHHIKYDSVTALLNQTGANKPFRWQIGLIKEGKKRGYVYVNALDDSVAYYSATPTPKTSSSHSSSSSASDSGDGFAHDVKSTFLGIGGDLQQFFTGERTVDK